MKILHLNAGNESGGGMFHILSLLNELNREEFFLGVFEKGEMYKRGIEQNIQLVNFDQKSKFDFTVVRKIGTFIRKHGIDMIHTHGARANCYAPFIRKRTGVKWVVTVHSDPRDDFMGQGITGKVFTKTNLNALKQADHFLAISERFKTILLDLGIPAEKITVILNGIDFDKPLSKPFEREELGVNEGDFVMLMVARLEAVKNHKLALTAIRNLIQHHHQIGIKLLIVGDGSEREELESFVKANGLSSCVGFLGHRNDVERLYPLSDLVLLTSYSESFPLVLLEAARSNVPVITTDVGGVDLLIPSDDYGWIVPIDDEKSLTEKLLTAMELKRNERLREIGQKLRMHSRDNFSVEHFAKNVYNVYLRLLG
ncbi:glycosyltransferase family 4 protein [Rossellomorea marisflavi]|uniref:glycosyltransferase family 4 protein n=1 Tax=Rossellomorea marisflavi TaxID=189381 RepID=UPI00285348CD|nr:glycosyltransferase family 4 protein [Rossellomorea marisflavi]MDR4935267.1 glycosyltransferase family 4 protein [Rossellomorea marisflavi]